MVFKWRIEKGPLKTTVFASICTNWPKSLRFDSTRFFGRKMSPIGFPVRSTFHGDLHPRVHTAKVGQQITCLPRLHWYLLGLRRWPGSGGTQGDLGCDKALFAKGVINILSLWPFPCSKKTNLALAAPGKKWIYFRGNRNWLGYTALHYWLRAFTGGPFRVEDITPHFIRVQIFHTISGDEQFQIITKAWKGPSWSNQTLPKALRTQAWLLWPICLVW